MIRSYRKRFSRSAPQREGRREDGAKTEGSETATERAKSLKCLITVAEAEATDDGETTDWKMSTAAAAGLVIAQLYLNWVVVGMSALPRAW